MSASPKHSNNNNVFSRGGFLKTAAVGLIGAGVGVVGKPVEHAAAAEPLVETCEQLLAIIVSD